MRIQLWSYNYDPEPQGIAPLSGILARSLQARGHEVLVVAAHPHYPEPAWGVRVRPYRERREGVSVMRLPIWPGRSSTLARLRQEVSFALGQALVGPLLPPAEVLIAVTPSFPALAAAAAFSRMRGIPWVMWLQDIATDGAETTGLLSGPLLDGAMRFERSSYESASRIVVISQAFRRNLLAKDVAEGKLELIYNPSTRPVAEPNVVSADGASTRVLAMGNIGHTQGLDRIVRAFEASSELERLGARLVIAGSGVAANEVRAQIKTGRVDMPGVLYGDRLEPELRGASLGLVSQRPDVVEFNLPSKLMNYLAYGLPVMACVRSDSETARIVRESGGGWVVDARDLGQFGALVAEKLGDVEGRRAAGQAGYAFARERFSPMGVAARFETVLYDAVEKTRWAVRPRCSLASAGGRWVARRRRIRVRRARLSRPTAWP